MDQFSDLILISRFQPFWLSPTVIQGGVTKTSTTGLESRNSGCLDAFVVPDF